MADGQHIPAMNPMGEGVCMHVGNPCSFSVSYFSGQPFPLPVRTWHSLERKSRYGGACLRNTDHTRLYVKPGSCRTKSDGKKANPLQLFSLGREIKRQSHPALLGRCGLLCSLLVSGRACIPPPAALLSVSRSHRRALAVLLNFRFIAFR